METPVRICFIGDGSHANRIKNALKNLKINCSFVEFDRTKALNSQPDLLDCHAVFITSPNNTHAMYLDELNKYFYGYIYCEKPPINKINQINILENINPSKCFFGFNYRYSKIFSFVEEMKEKYNLGKEINMYIHVSYPFAIKEAYLKSWKSKITKSPLGVIENLGIHYIDLAINLFGKFRNVFIIKNNICDTGSAIDTATIFCEHENNASTQIFVSYATLVKDEIYFTFENGDINYDGITLNLLYPKNTFDESGLAVCPSIASSSEIGGYDLYDKSLNDCVEAFMAVVINEEKFESILFENSKMSTLAMLEIA